MIEGVEHLFKGFGTVQMPYYTISKGKMSWMKKVFIKCKQQIQKREKK
jgi:hypothetical protein